MFLCLLCICCRGRSPSYGSLRARYLDTFAQCWLNCHGNGTRNHSAFAHALRQSFLIHKPGPAEFTDSLLEATRRAGFANLSARLRIVLDRSHFSGDEISWSRKWIPWSGCGLRNLPWSSFWQLDKSTATVVHHFLMRDLHPMNPNLLGTLRTRER